MLARIRKALQEREEGFTLIELLVVIIIIGILAAIAIPVFLNQRNKGYDAAAKSDLKNMSIAEETYLTDNGNYTTSVTSLVGEGFNKSSNVDGWTASVSGGAYTLVACSQSGTKWQYTSSSGSVTAAGTCTF